jgi:hypothetical protein
MQNGQNAPVLLFTVDGGPFDTRVDTGGGFANITSANADAFADFNGIDIKIPGLDRSRGVALAALVALSLSPLQPSKPRPSFSLQARFAAGACVRLGSGAGEPLFA